MGVQLITLLGVLLGAASSYLATFAMDRARYRRDLEDRWTERRMDAYISYLNDVKEMRGITRRILRDTGLVDTNLPIALPKEEGLPLLAAAEARRSIFSERVSLVGSEDIINALRALNQAIWRIEWFARGLIDNADIGAWRQASDEYHAAINSFQEFAYRDLWGARKLRSQVESSGIACSPTRNRESCPQPRWVRPSHGRRLHRPLPSTDQRCG